MKTTFLSITDLTFDEQDNSLLRFVSVERQNKIQKYKHDKVRKLSLYSALLTRMELSGLLNVPTDKLYFNTNEHGKPFLLQYPDIFFNFSHSKSSILFSLSTKNQVGVDIEGFTSYSHLLVKKIFHPFELAQYNQIENAHEKEALFFKIWTIKEAYSKYLGTGINFELNKLNTFDKEIESLCFTGTYNNFAYSICSLDKVISPINHITDIDIKNFYLS